MLQAYHTIPKVRLSDPRARGDRLPVVIAEVAMI